MATKGIVKKKNKFVPSKNYSFRCSEDQIRLFKRVFDLYDDDNDGKMDSKFLGLALRAAGAIISNAKIESILNDHDPQKLNLPIDLSDYFIFMARILREQDNIKGILEQSISYVFTDNVVLRQKVKKIDRAMSKKQSAKKLLQASGKILTEENVKSISIDDAQSESTPDIQAINPDEMRPTIPLGVLRSHLLTKIESDETKIPSANDKIRLSYADALEHFIADDRIKECTLESRKHKAHSVYVDSVIDALMADKLNEELLETVNTKKRNSKHASVKHAPKNDEHDDEHDDEHEEEHEEEHDDDDG